MKLLILLITLLAGTNPSSSMPVQSTTTGFSGGIIMEAILEELQTLKETFDTSKHEIKVKTFKPISIKTPQDIKNACTCGEMFKEELKESVSSIVAIWNSDHFHNIFESLEVLTFKTPQTDNCHFKNHTITKSTLSNIKTFLLMHNIRFIQQWNTICH